MQVLNTENYFLRPSCSHINLSMPSGILHFTDGLNNFNFLT